MKEMLQGLMQDDFPLTLEHIRRRMRTSSPEAEVVTLLDDDTDVEEPPADESPPKKLSRDERL